MQSEERESGERETGHRPEPTEHPAPDQPAEADRRIEPDEAAERDRPRADVWPSEDAAGARRADRSPEPDEARPAGTGQAGGLDESTQCPRCGTENRPGLAFCRNCGQRLVAAGVAPTVERPGTPEGTQACPRCGTHNRAGVPFCQNCGANLRGVAAPGYVPPSVVAGAQPDVSVEREGGALLGPIVLIIGAIGLVTAWLLPFAYGSGSLYERGFAAGGYGVAFWEGYPDVGGTVADQAYFGFAAPAPVVVGLLAALAIGGFLRATPGIIQRLGLVLTLLWGAGLAVLFVVVEVAGNWGGELIAMLSDLSPAGIIFLLASLIVVIGSLTRFGRG